MLILTFDLGTTRLKTALYTFSYSYHNIHPELSLLASISTEISYQRQTGILLEMNPSDFWETILVALQQVCQQASRVPNEIDRISITSQAQTFCLLSKDLIPLTPFISWADRRASDQAHRLSALIGSDHHVHCSFPKPVAEMASCKHLWLVEQEPAIRNATKWSMPLPSWLGMKMGARPYTDRNLAAMSGLYSLRLRSWWPEALAACGVQSFHFPRLVNPGVSFTIQSPNPFTMLRPGVSIVMAGNDQTCGALSSQIQTGEILVTLGSALVAYAVIRGDPGPYIPDACWGEFPGGAYYQLATLSDGTIALDWAIKQFNRENCISSQFEDLQQNLTLESFSEIAQMQLEKNHIGINRSSTEVFFYPERSKEDAPPPLALHMHPAFWGCGSVAEYYLSVFEGISFALKALIQDLFSDHNPSRVLVSGGGSTNAFWVQMIANILGQMVVVVSSNPSTGAAILAALGESQNNEIAFHNQETPFSPQLDMVKYYSGKYQRWLSHRDRTI